jgi:hypothetical protein
MALKRIKRLKKTTDFISKDLLPGPALPGSAGEYTLSHEHRMKASGFQY